MPDTAAGSAQYEGLVRSRQMDEILSELEALSREALMLRWTEVIAVRRQIIWDTRAV